MYIRSKVVALASFNVCEELLVENVLKRWCVHLPQLLLPSCGSWIVSLARSRPWNCGYIWRTFTSVWN